VSRVCEAHKGLLVLKFSQNVIIQNNRELMMVKNNFMFIAAVAALSQAAYGMQFQNNTTPNRLYNLYYMDRRGNQNLRYAHYLASHGDHTEAERALKGHETWLSTECPDTFRVYLAAPKDERPEMATALFENEGHLIAFHGDFDGCEKLVGALAAVKTLEKQKAQFCGELE
jgi:hypothetical protein